MQAAVIEALNAPMAVHDDWPEQVMLREHLRSADLQEGLRAFAEKRKPTFTGR
jgi:hypothetical protein